VLALVLVLAALAAAAAAAFNSGGDKRGDSERRASTSAIAGRGTRRHRSRHVRPQAGGSGRGGVERVLRYTPFVAVGSPRHRVIALTFDDGPSPYTPQIVRILVRRHVPATFFIVGQQLRYFGGPLRDEVRHGYTVGDHTQNHAWLPHLSASAQEAQITGVAAGVSRLGAPSPVLFRPPYGMYNQATLGILHRRRMLMVLWSVDPGDWRRPGTPAIVSNVLRHARPGAIVIMHDGGGDRSQTVAALRAIIQGLRRRGFRLVSVPQLLRLDPPPRHQHLPALTGAG
jgi:peptidoglycan-N-acetylglucosamine deacetylase